MPLIEEFLDEITRIRKRSKNTIATYTALLNSFKNFLEGKGKSLENFGREELAEYLSILKSRNTKNIFLTILRQMVRFYKERLIPPVGAGELRRHLLELRRIDEVLNTKVPSESGPRPLPRRRALSIEELEGLLERTRGSNVYDVVFLLAYFGFRKSELLGLDGGSVDFKEGKLTVQSAKTRQLRTLFFDDQAGVVLKRFLEYSGRLASHHINFAFRKFGVTPHMLRHTFNTYMRKRVDDVTLKTLMGHAVRQDITDRYTTVFDEELRRAMLECHYFKLLRRDVLSGGGEVDSSFSDSFKLVGQGGE